MKLKILLLSIMILIIPTINAQNNTNQIFDQAQQYYEQANQTRNWNESLKLMYTAIYTIMHNFPSNKMEQVMYASKVLPMMKDYLHSSMSYLSAHRSSNTSPSADMYNMLKDTNIATCNTLFLFLELNSEFVFIWDPDFNEEYVYFLRGRAKFFLGMPDYIDDINRAGKIGQDFLRSWM